MPILSGPDVKFASSNHNNYETALHLLAEAVQGLLCNAYFYERLGKQISGGKMSPLAATGSQFSRQALFAASVQELYKLVDTRGDAWNLEQLYPEWARFEHSDDRKREVKSAVKDFQSKLKRYKDLRSTYFGHISKKASTLDIVALPRKLPYLKEAVEILDRFASSPIPYELYLYGSKQRVDLRAKLGISAG